MNHERRKQEKKKEEPKGKKQTTKKKTPQKKIVSEKEIEKEKIIVEPKKEVDHTKALKIIFFALLIVVILLCHRLSKISKTEEKIDANIVIPIVEKKDLNEFSIDVSDMKKQDELDYVIKLINYEDENITKENINYKITITKIDGIKIEKTKIGEEKQIKEDVIKGQMQNKEQEEIYYKLHLKATKNMNESAQISIKIETEG